MFSSSTAAAAKAMRPGLIAGCCPERQDTPSGWFELTVNAIHGRLLNLVVDQQAGLGRIVEAVKHQGESLTGLSGRQMDQRLVQLRRRFRAQGLNRSLCVQAMALIREVSGRTLGMRHYDTQLMAGWVMLQGQLAEMETGEGKTLTATLPAATAALAGIPVHVITVNEYLVERDANLMGPLYQALGLTFGHVVGHMTDEARRAAYANDITYSTNDQVAFDYLRDRLQLGRNRNRIRMQLRANANLNSSEGKLLLRGLSFAIVDEADSVLIDEARTPLILTRSMDSTDEHQLYRKTLEIARQLKMGNDFILDESPRSILLSRSGQQRLAAMVKEIEIIPASARQREALVSQALHALYLLKKDRDYLVSEDKVVIIDANTGRPMPDRSWERGLHQMVEAKEHCPLTDAREQLGRITYQRFFRRYLRLGGMSGTAREVGTEIWSVYGLRVRRIPLHRPSLRRSFPTQIFARMEEKWMAVIHSVQWCRQLGRPVLIGTDSVAESETLSRRLTAAGIAHQVLNARQDADEAQIVTAAGRMGRVTVATNMAGRGTDIPLGTGVSDVGGLHVIAACRNEARRIDRQLYGRCARHGDPGSHEVILSLEDELIQCNCSPALVRSLIRRTEGKYLFQSKLNRFLFRRAQLRLEHRHRRTRHDLLELDRQNHRRLAFSGNME